MVIFKLAVLLTCAAVVKAEGFLRVCYFSNAAQFRPEEVRMTPGDIDPNLCTHLIYAFAKLDSNSELSFTEWNDGDMVKEFNGLKRRNPYLKTLLAVGGYNQGSKSFSDMAADRNLRAKFVRKAIEFVKKWGFDGLDLDWEFPAGRDGGRKADKRNFISLLMELREAINTGNEKLLLTAAVPAGKDEIDKGYDIAKMEEYLDFINLMSYDFPDDKERTAEHNSPLYPRDSETEHDRRKNVDWAAEYWVDNGIPKEKLVIGLPTYGRHYKLSNKKNYDVGARVKRAGKKGPYTKEDGFLAFYEICKLKPKGKVVDELDSNHIMYLIHKDHWIGYDDEKSFIMKLKYIKDKGFGGAMVWSLDLDDFKKVCPNSKRQFPLVSLLAETLGEYKPDDRPEDDWDSDSTGNDDKSDYKRVCYFTNWAQYRKEPGEFFPRDIDPSLCTHLIYCFANLDEGSSELIMTEWNDEVLYSEFNGLKSQNPNLKTLIATGGWNAGSKVYSNMVADVNKRKIFAKTSVEFLRAWGFDGLDLDWEYPASNGGVPADKKNFIELLKDLNEEFDADVRASNRPRLLLTAAVAAGKSKIDAAYDIPQMAMYLDFINLMSYDLHGDWDTFVGHNSPLYARYDEQGLQSQLNTDWAAQYWVQKGTPPEKLIIGLALYGRNYELLNPNQNNFGDPIFGPGSKGPYTGQPGFLAYYEICQILSTGVTAEWNAEHEVPYLVDGNEWIGYDNEDSIWNKLQYIKSQGFGGAMVWAIDLDDFNDQCLTGKYPLMNVIKNELSSNGNGQSLNDYQEGSNPPAQRPPAAAQPTQRPPQTAAPTQRPPQTAAPTQRPPQTAAPPPSTNPDTLCQGKPHGSYNAHPDDCAKFVICVFERPIIQSCAPSTYWNQKIKNCDHMYNVDCKTKRTLDTNSNLERSALETLLKKLEMKMSGADLETSFSDLSRSEKPYRGVSETSEGAHLDNPATAKSATEIDDDWSESLDNLARDISATDTADDDSFERDTVNDEDSDSEEDYIF